MEKQKVISYEDLDVYKRAYTSCLRIFKEILSKLPAQERFDLKDQLSRSSKSIPRLISEGFAKKYQKAGYQKYLTDAIGESNETEVSLAQSRDLYPHDINPAIANELIAEYKIIGKQLFKLQESWSKFSGPKR
ncbi:MAG: four helix bundle protein [Saprospiraceae bacterium]|uniref:Four helix bundle protein n=1 Tax=Candidatus Opimibacter skivensis TaxID=2982028 RepID=A0A9D7SXC0_9BACT|nr:four helix bundle protein [Candidatus Opimibacter skivensis]